MNFSLAVVELVVPDMPATLAFYRRLGLDIPAAADGEPHVDVELAGGLRLAFDSEAVLTRIDPAWSPPTGGHRGALAFDCTSPAAVDSAYAELTDAGYEGHLAPWDVRTGVSRRSCRVRGLSLATLRAIPAARAGRCGRHP